MNKYLYIEKVTYIDIFISCIHKHIPYVGISHRGHLHSAISISLYIYVYIYIYIYVYIYIFKHISK